MVERRNVTLYGDWVARLNGYVNARIQPQVSGISGEFTCEVCPS
jgi:hypothetical protein